MLQNDVNVKEMLDFVCPIPHTVYMTTYTGGEVTMKCSLDCGSGEDGFFTVPGAEDSILACPTCWFDDPTYGGGMDEEFGYGKYVTGTYAGGFDRYGMRV